MAFTVENRKTEYLNLIAKKGEELYSEWVKDGISSKTITDTADDLAFRQSLKNSFAIRIDVQIFIYALEKRIENRYDGILSRLFHPFKYRKELSALKTLKRVLGFKSDTECKDILDVEMERLAVAVSKEVDEDDDTEGGLISQLTEPTIEEELEAFLQLEEETLEKSNEKIERRFFFKEKENSENDKSSPSKVEKGKTPVKSTKTVAKKPSSKPTEEKKVEKNGKGKSVDKEKVKQPEKKVENLSTKTSSIIPEAMGLGMIKKEEDPSPFPVFRDEVVSDNAKQVEKTTENVKNETLNKITENKSIVEKEAISVDSESEKARVFPVFGKVDHTKIHPVFRDKPGDANKNVGEAKNDTNKNGIPKNNNLPNDKANKIKPMEISEENLARRELNNNMSREQIVVIAEQIQEAAHAMLERHDELLRQGINVDPKDIMNDGGEVRENQIPVPQNLNK